MKFRLFLKNGVQDDFYLDFLIYNHPIAIKWYNALAKQCANDNIIAEKDRLYNFPNNLWDEARIISELNNCIDFINQKEVHISHSAFPGMPQTQLNQLHLYFEQLRGGILSPGAFYTSASPEERKALQRYNVLIHRAENFYSIGNRAICYPRIVSRFSGRPRLTLDDADYQHFTLVRNFGEVYINYCEVGKPLQDVYKDNDLIISAANIRPLRYYSADFTTYLYDNPPTNVHKFLAGMETWWIANSDKLANLGFIWGDPKNAIGNIPVACLETSMSRKTIIDTLCQFNTMDRVEII